jgi:hypothetical protein
MWYEKGRRITNNLHMQAIQAMKISTSEGFATWNYCGRSWQGCRTTLRLAKRGEREREGKGRRLYPLRCQTLVREVFLFESPLLASFFAHVALSWTPTMPSSADIHPSTGSVETFLPSATEA